MKNNKFTKSICIAISISMVFSPLNSYRVAAKEDDSNKNKQESNNEITNSQDSSNLQENFGRSFENMTEIKIANAEEFNDFVRNCTLDTWSADKYVVLTDDIDLSKTGFTPVPSFAGVFDGDGHDIVSALYEGRESYEGLFSKTQPSAIIENINVIGIIHPEGNSFDVGGIVGRNSGMITNCSFEGYVEGYDYVGGICGYNEALGTISKCTASGKITGMHFTGGIVGSNSGIVTACENKAEVNTANKNIKHSLEDIKIEQIMTSIIAYVKDRDDKSGSAQNASQNPLDMGGIAGVNTGTIGECTNMKAVGYDHVGYNVGGICGRQSGYIHNCENHGTVKGRKDVGGIVGQAEPYIFLDLTEDIINQLTDNINILHDGVDKTIRDTDSSSDVVSARLNVIKDFADKALSDTTYLANGTQDLINGITGSTNEIISRGEYVLGELSKDNGPMAETEAAGDELKKMSEELEHCAEDLHIENYLSPEESATYNSAKTGLTDGYDEYRKYYDVYKKSPEWQSKYEEGLKKAYDTSLKAVKAEYYENTLADICEREYQKKYDEVYASYEAEIAAGTKTPEEVERLADEAAAEHVRNNKSSYESVAENAAEEYIKTDEAKKRAAEGNETSATAYADKAAAEYAEQQYSAKHPGHTYTSDMKSNSEIIANTIIGHGDDIIDAETTDAGYAFGHAKDMAERLKGAAGSVKTIVTDVDNMPDIRFPTLSDEYRGHTNSLMSNISGMSDNLGFLNNEMNGQTDEMCDDLKNVNDQFNTIMLLFTDAMDGALDKDYSDVFEDDSNDVAESCTDATLYFNLNYGNIFGDINVGGIAGTMAREYDFDLESDVTGIEDSNTSSTYRTKCVLRDNTNRAPVSGQKSYVGGIVGMQEMGTILRGNNFSKISSSSGDYVGGIAGRSLATICSCYEKGLLEGKSYIGGIAGMGVDVSKCLAMPVVLESDTFAGAILGDSDTNAVLAENIFVGDELAGVDRVSLSEKAEPISYRELINMPNIPEEYSLMNVFFTLEDEVIGSLQKRYGEELSADDFDSIKTPNSQIVMKDGVQGENSCDHCYIIWDKEQTVAKADMEISGELVRYNTTLAGKNSRDEKQSIVLVDGKFYKGDEIIDSIFTSEDGYTEECRITIPDDKQEEHLIRYAPLLDDKGKAKEFCIYVKGSEGEVSPEVGIEYGKADLSENGRYITFLAKGNEVEFKAVYSMPINYTKWIIIGSLTAVAVLGICLTFIFLFKKENKKRTYKDGI